MMRNKQLREDPESGKSSISSSKCPGGWGRVRWWGEWLGSGREEGADHMSNLLSLICKMNCCDYY